ncbi:group-specific protein [Virgibacillus dakarensis]|uniref:Group-specific protein n=1 Tax=Lentibacillus populi TaxID=1827502 RepID=A0A9W5TY96_9BACI|nr:MULTISPECIES: group-specific protein [Bacillaceae]MBT2215675.1 group-specific protein [Virgibacillus dakarensis]MTW85710.1 group-specific protein [Virgibacillus dakarensis]GGB46146.1 hypothetical protein GCM10011409_24660 [Lentibacillus populi]
MDFYIASSFSNKNLVRYIAQKLIIKGFRQTYDWTKNVRADTPATLQSTGELEKNAVASSDIFILLLPGGKGSHTELGIALALGKRVYIYSEEALDPVSCPSFYFVKGVERFHGKKDDFISTIGLV